MGFKVQQLLRKNRYRILQDDEEERSPREPSPPPRCYRDRDWERGLEMKHAIMRHVIHAHMYAQPPVAFAQPTGPSPMGKLWSQISNSVRKLLKRNTNRQPIALPTPPRQRKEASPQLQAKALPPSDSSTVVSGSKAKSSKGFGNIKTMEFWICNRNEVRLKSCPEDEDDEEAEQEENTSPKSQTQGE